MPMTYENEISFCEFCHCMTKVVRCGCGKCGDLFCGKCGGPKIPSFKKNKKGAIPAQEKK